MTKKAKYLNKDQLPRLSLAITAVETFYKLWQQRSRKKNNKKPCFVRSHYETDPFLDK